MPYNDTTYNAAQTQRTALRNALVNFATSTLPTTVTAVKAAVVNLDATHPMLDGLQPEDVRFYRACVQYVNELKAAGRYSGAAFPYP